MCWELQLRLHNGTIILLLKEFVLVVSWGADFDKINPSLYNTYIRTYIGGIYVYQKTDY